MTRLVTRLQRAQPVAEYFLQHFVGQLRIFELRLQIGYEVVLVVQVVDPRMFQQLTEQPRSVSEE